MDLLTDNFGSLMIAFIITAFLLVTLFGLIPDLSNIVQFTVKSFVG